MSWSVRARSRPCAPARQLGLGLLGLALEEPLHDLRLERDVGDALRRAVVHLARDVAPHLLLRVSTSRAPSLWPPAPAARAPSVRRRGAHDRHDLRPDGRGSAAERAACPEDVELRLHQRRASASAASSCGAPRQARRSGDWSRSSVVDALLGLSAARLVALCLGRGLAQQQLDLGQLAFERRAVRSSSASSSASWGSVRFQDQSSGIRIQPCFMA